jgi:hypothetical protein
MTFEARVPLARRYQAASGISGLVRALDDDLAAIIIVVYDQNPFRC